MRARAPGFIGLAAAARSMAATRAVRRAHDGMAADLSATSVLQQSFSRSRAAKGLGEELLRAGALLSDNGDHAVTRIEHRPLVPGASRRVRCRADGARQDAERGRRAARQTS